MRHGGSDRWTGTTRRVRSDSYTLPSRDLDFLQRDELRPFRLGLELLKPEMIQTEQGVVSTIAVFGSSRTPEPEAARVELERARRGVERVPDDADAQATLETRGEGCRTLGLLRAGA